MAPDPARVLLLEDNIDDAAEAQRALSTLPSVELRRVRTVREAEPWVAGEPLALAVLDYRLPDGSGVAFCRRLRSGGFRGPVLVVTSVASDAIAREALEAGATDLIVKSEGFGEALRARVERLLGAQSA